MSKQVELALLSLMPTYGKDLPPQLIELAGSLLAQSRDRASALKQEEEIARHYACANIACDGLKISLDLPTVVPRPPIPPRIYKRLYTHLDNILPNPSSSRRASSRVRTPVAKFSIEESPARPLPSRGTPSKDQSLAQFRSTNSPSTRHKTSARFESAPSKSGLRPWIAPVARFFCHETDNKRLAPTILAGMDHVTRQAVQTEDAWVREHTTKALVSIYFFVMMRVKALSSAEIDGKQSYVALRKEIVELLCRARNDVTFTGAEDDGAWDGYTILTLKDFDDAIAYAKEQTWFESDWFEGIAGVVKSDTDTRMADAETFDGADEPVRRADTMFQDKFDFLSESRRSDFKIWKERQLTRIMELSVTNGAMEVDSH